MTPSPEHDQQGSFADPNAYTADVSGFADIVDEWGRQSFPASDPPANW